MALLAYLHIGAVGSDLAPARKRFQCLVAVKNSATTFWDAFLRRAIVSRCRQAKRLRREAEPEIGEATESRELGEATVSRRQSRLAPAKPMCEALHIREDLRSSIPHGAWLQRSAIPMACG